jgi:thiamine pyrophosphokinase
MAEIEKIVGEVGKKWQFTVNDGATPYDLTGATAAMHAQSRSGPSVAGSPFTLTILGGTGGRADYTVTATDFNVGEYLAQIKVVKGGSTFYTDEFVITVRRAL